MTKTFTRLSAPVLLTFLMTACGSPPASVSPSPSQAIILQPVARSAATAPATEPSVLADVGHGTKTPAQLRFNIKLSNLGDFRVKDSSPGTAAKTNADLHTIKFYLVASDTGTPPTALSGTGFTYALTQTNHTNGTVSITFTNVQANATGKSYYVVAAGFSSATATAANNITNLNAPISDATEGKYFASTSGGSPDGAVRVTPVTYAISGTTALGVPLKLLDATTPTLESAVSISDGDELTGSYTGSGE